MSEGEYKFFAPISNAGGHFRSLKIPSPFRIERWNEDKILSLWRRIEGLPKWEISFRLHRSNIISPGGKTGHVITGCVPGEREFNYEHHESVLRPTEAPLEHWIRCVRLVTNGHVEMAAAFWYQEYGRKYEMLSAVTSDLPIKEKHGTVNASSVAKDNALLARLALPLKHEYIKLAWDHWDESFRTHQENLEFLQLMMALEVLFNVGQHDIRYRIARSAAVLLGEDREHSEFCYDSIREAYDFRSQLVHTGKTKGLNRINIWYIRSLVQRAILDLLLLDMSKDQAAQALTKLGFGDREELTNTSRLTRATPRAPQA